MSSTENIFIERFWRTIKYEHLYLRAYPDGHSLHQGLTEYFRFYNHERKHQSLNYQTPAVWYERGIEGKEEVQFPGFIQPAWKRRNPVQRLGSTILADSLLPLGIDFKFELNTIHDRSITLNNGWKIVLGRGLDIYQKTNGRYDIAELLPEKRLCRACEITYLQINWKLLFSVASLNVQMLVSGFCHMLLVALILIL